MIKPKVNEIYRHFKGNMYQIVCIAEDSETGKEQVVYRALYAPYKIYVRELSMFMSRVDKKKYPDVTQVDRFELMIFDDVTQEYVDESYEEGDDEYFEEPYEEAYEEAHDESYDENKDEIYDEQKAVYTPSYTPADKSGISPVLLRFLETEGVNAQIECITEIREQLTPEILTSIEFSIGMEEAQKGDVYERYRGVKNYLQLKQKYERQHR